MISSLQNRFFHVFQSVDFELAAVLHPHFRLVALLPQKYDDDDDEAVFARKQRQTQDKTIRVLKIELKADERAGSSKNDPEEETKDDFFSSFFDVKQSPKGSATKLVKSLEEPSAKNNF